VVGLSDTEGTALRAYSFFITVHLDRFSDLKLITGDLPVVVEPYSALNDTIEVYITGEAETTLKLDRELQKIKDILSIAPVVEEV
jgi:hypothetical protein